MINEEKEKEIVSMLEKQKNSKLFLEVTGYISRLDGYIYKLEKKNKKLESLIENLKLGVTLNEEQEKLLDSILFGSDKYE